MNNKSLAHPSELRKEIATIDDPEQKLISECMYLVVAALEVGANVDRLVKQTGYSKDFIEMVSGHMRTAGLWVGKHVDDREWSDRKLKEGFAIFLHALVAKGDLMRIWQADGTYQYVDVHTGVVDYEWRPSAAACT